MNEKGTAQRRKDDQLRKNETEEATKATRQEHKNVPDPAGSSHFSLQDTANVPIFSFYIDVNI